MEQNLTLSEKLLLLAIRPGKGGIMAASSLSVDFVVLGAQLLELSLEGKVEIRDKRIELKSGVASSDLHGYLLERLSRCPRPRKVDYWLNAFSISRKKVKTGVYASLEAKREIRMESRKFLFFKWKIPVLLSGNHASGVVSEIKNLLAGRIVHAGDIYLLALADAGDFMRRVYPERDKRRAARVKIRSFLKEDRITEGQATATARVFRDAIVRAVAARHSAGTV